MSTQKFIIVEAIIPATGDLDGDHDILAAIKPAVTALKEVVHKLANPGTVTTRHSSKTGPRETAAKTNPEPPAPSTNTDTLTPKAERLSGIKAA